MVRQKDELTETTDQLLQMAADMRRKAYGPMLLDEAARQESGRKWQGFAAVKAPFEYELAGDDDDSLTAQEWAELAHLANVASQERPELMELRDKVRRIAQARNGREESDA